MRSNQAILHVCSSAHFCRAAKQNPHLTRPHFGKKLLLFSFRIRIVNERDFTFRHTLRQQFFANIVVDAELLFILLPGFRRRHIAEDELRELLLAAFSVNAQHVADTGVDLASGVVRQHGIHEPLIQSQFLSV